MGRGAQQQTLLCDRTPALATGGVLLTPFCTAHSHRAGSCHVLTRHGTIHATCGFEPHTDETQYLRRWRWRTDERHNADLQAFSASCLSVQRKFDWFGTPLSPWVVCIRSNNMGSFTHVSSEHADENQYLDTQCMFGVEQFGQVTAVSGRNRTRMQERPALHVTSLPN